MGLCCLIKRRLPQAGESHQHPYSSLIVTWATWKPSPQMRFAGAVVKLPGLVVCSGPESAGDILLKGQPPAAPTSILLHLCELNRNAF